MTAGLASVPADVAAMLRRASDDDLAGLFATGDPDVQAAVIATCEERDRKAAWRESPRGQAHAAAVAEWDALSHQEYLTAEARCPVLLSAAGQATGREAWPMLWTCRRDEFDRWASDDLKHWVEHRELSVTRRGEYLAGALWTEDRSHPRHEVREAVMEETATAPEPNTREWRLAQGHSKQTVDAAERMKAASARRLAGGIAPGPAAGAAEAGERARTTLATPAAEIPAALGGDGAGALAVPERPASPTLLVRRPRINGAGVLDQAYRFTGALGHWPSDEVNVASAVWTGFANGRDKTGRLVFPYSPRLFFTSEQGGSGKTRLSTSVLMLCPDARTLVESTKASFKRFLRKRCTIRVTELDNWIGPNGRRNPWLLGIGNTGYEPNMHTSLVQNGSEVEIETLGAMLLDGLSWVMTSTGAGEMTKTFTSRALIFWVERAPEGYRAPRLSDEVYATGRMIQARLAAWMAQEIEDGMQHDVPDMTGLPGNRPGALWEPLCMVADRAGGPWPDAIRDACLRLEAPGGQRESDEDKAAEIEAALGRLGAGWDEED